MSNTKPKPRRKRYRLLLGAGEYQMRPTQWRSAIQRGLLVKLSEFLAEAAPGTELRFEDGVLWLRDKSKPSPWVLTNWWLIQRKNPAPPCDEHYQREIEQQYLTK